MTRPKTGMDLNIAIARQLRMLREQAGVPREFVALRARHWGFDWTASTVALIEDGRRRLSIGEFLLLPTILNEVLTHKDQPITLEELLPTDETVTRLAITPQLLAYTYALRTLIEHRGVMSASIPGGRLEDLFDCPGMRELQLYDEAAERAAKALKVPISSLVTHVERLWKRPMGQERDNRLEEALRASGEGHLTPRRRQALRGHITRLMLKELRQYLGMKSHPSPRLRKGGRRRGS